MLSLDLIRKEPESVCQALANRGEDPTIVSKALDLDTRRRTTVTERDRFRAQQNEASRRVGSEVAEARRRGDPAEPPPALREELAQLSQRIEQLDRDAEAIVAQQNALLLTIPNIPQPDVAVGPEETANRVIRAWGAPVDFPFRPRPHWELGEKLGIIDLERGAKLSGSRFFVLRGKGARLERAIISWMLDVHTREHGYTEFHVPYLVKSETLVGSGNLPKFGDNLYHDAEEDLWLIPTAEVPLTNLHRDEILEPGTLPLRYTAFTPCFRREKAAAGRDTRGIKRVHQFDKVELYNFVEPSKSAEALETMVRCAETLLQRLGIPHRVIQLSTQGIGFASSKTYDLEAWAPGSDEWLEVSSCSTCTDFQARRANIRYRPVAGARPEFPHTLNGSALALPRTFIAILENNQQPDGSVVIPEVLRPYTGFDRIEVPEK
ncbi:MAG: serine--tRNA ligase [Dehalococcoidia bacterium]|nr:serine--tRNA ligase [Dehalococcoidia bacterium]